MRVWVVSAAVAAALLASPGWAQRKHRVGAPSDWVEEVPVPTEAVADTRTERSDRQRLLYDRQDRVHPNRIESFRRYVTRITSPAGIAAESEIALEFDPTYEELTLHRIVIHRDGKRIDALKTASIENLSLEDDLDRRIYDRRVTVHAILKDVRVGDVVEYAFSRQGGQPALGGKYAAVALLGHDTQVKRLRVRLLFPKERALRVGLRRTNAAPKIEEFGDERAYVWDLSDTPAVAEEDRLPGWFDPYPAVEFSEFASWNEVAGWAVRLYEPHRALGPKLNERVREWSRLVTPAERLRATLRFVQDEIRYLGVEVGPHSLEPHDAEAVLDQRFGDCKDKSLLLVTLLRGLGVEADPALVHTERRHMVGDSEPSPYAFDHVIVRARLDGKELWLDPTSMYQRGALERLMPPLYRKALIVHPESRELVTIPEHTYQEPAIQIHERYSVRKDDQPALFEVSTRYLEDEADNARTGFASNIIAERERYYLNFYAQKFPTIEISKPMSTANDDAANEFRVEEAYSIRYFWRDGARDLYAWSIGEYLAKPKVAKRQMPLAIEHPVFVRQVFDVDLPEKFELKPLDITLSGTAFAFRARSSFSGTRLVLTYELRTLSDHVLPNDVPAHIELIDSIEDALTYRLESAGAELPSSEQRGGPWVPAGVALAVMFGTALLFLRIRRTRKALDEAELTEGANARAPLLINFTEDIQAHAQRLRCNCAARAGLIVEQGSEQEVWFRGRALLVSTLVCPACRTQRPRYFYLLGDLEDEYEDEDEVRR